MRHFYSKKQILNQPLYIFQNLVDNGMGSKNNLVSVRKSDFEVFQALAKDSEGIISSAQTEYGQEVPPHKPWEKTAGPPILPPHLLQVILNKDTPLSVSRYYKL